MKKVAPNKYYIRSFRRSGMIHIDLRDWWIGYYNGDTRHYICIIPTLVISWAKEPVG